MRPIRLLIADDHPVVRDGLRAMLATQPDMELVGEAATGTQAVAHARALRPDVVLMDLQMPDLDGPGAIAALGESVLPPSVAPRVLGRMRAPAEEALSPRELEILEAVARGLSNKDIGRQLYVSEATVKTHLLRVFSKLGVDDRTAAVTVALERGIIRLSG